MYILKFEVSFDNGSMYLGHIPLEGKAYTMSSLESGIFLNHAADIIDIKITSLDFSRYSSPVTLSVSEFRNFCHFVEVLRSSSTDFEAWAAYCEKFGKCLDVIEWSNMYEGMFGSKREFAEEWLSNMYGAFGKIREYIDWHLLMADLENEYKFIKLTSGNFAVFGVAA